MGVSGGGVVGCMLVFTSSVGQRARYQRNRILSPEVVRWLICNYSLVREQLDKSVLTGSIGKHEGAATSLTIAGESVWMCVCLNVCRTISSDCWVCVGPRDFVRESYDRFLDRWEKWNRKQHHRAAVLRRDVAVYS